VTDSPSPSLVPVRPPDDAIDITVVEGLRKLGSVANRDLLGELASLFLDVAPQRIAEMKSALAAGDAEVFLTVAHALRGSAGNLGIIGLAGLCELIERKTADGRLADCAPTLESAGSELARVTPWLESLRPRSPG
jgi:two-component system sensor histidine kinase RpfC